MNNEEAIRYLENMKWLKGYDNTTINQRPICEIIDEIISLIKQFGWVSVNNKLPDETDCYLVLLKNHGGVELDVFSKTLGVFKHNRQYVEYWAKLPSLPDT